MLRFQLKQNKDEKLNQELSLPELVKSESPNPEVKESQKRRTFRMPRHITNEMFQPFPIFRLNCGVGMQRIAPAGGTPVSGILVFCVAGPKATIGIKAFYTLPTVATEGNFACQARSHGG